MTAISLEIHDVSNFVYVLDFGSRGYLKYAARETKLKRNVIWIIDIYACIHYSSKKNQEKRIMYLGWIMDAFQHEEDSIAFKLIE